MQQIPLDVGLADEPSLDNFFPGPNVAVVQNLRQWLQDSRPDATTYLWGPAGSGKSHLLRACYAALQARGNSVGHLDPHGAQASEFDERWVAVVMDDVHLYSPVLQQTAFSWFVQAHTLQRPVLAAGLLQPSALALREDLRTRLGWGQVLALELLTEAQTREVLRKAANARGLALSDEVMDFTLRRFSRDLGSLMQLLNAMDRYALQTQRALTIPLVKSMLENA
jgi:DnaA family protein